MDARLIDDILIVLAKGGKYTLEDTKVEVQAVTLNDLMSALRNSRHGTIWVNLEQKWVLGHPSEFKSDLKAAGFTVTKGRSMRHYRGGKMGLGTVATIVTL